MTNGKGHRGHKEVRKAGGLNRVIGTVHGEDAVLKEVKTAVACCGGHCGGRSVHTTANVQKHGISKGCCTSRNCQLAFLEQANDEVARQKSLQPVQEEKVAVRSKGKLPPRPNVGVVPQFCGLIA